jgi:hypothetical protein
LTSCVVILSEAKDLSSNNAHTNLRGPSLRSGYESFLYCDVEGRVRQVILIVMCRNIKTLHNFQPPATDEEIRASSLQFIRKLSGFTKPSKANEVPFNRAVDQVTHVARELLDSLVTNAPTRDRETEAAKARARSAHRFHPADHVVETLVRGA